MRRGATALGAALAAAWLFGGACSDEDAMPAGRGGAAGASGDGGTAGRPMQGSGGAPQMGSGGGGMGGGGAGSGPCIDDAACALVGQGSLCVRSVCTAPEGDCAKQTLVVVAQGFAGSLDGAPVDACYYRTLDAALAAVDAQATTRLAVYAAEAQASAPVAVGPGVRLEGHGAQAGQPVTLAVTGAGGAPLVTLDAGASFAGFDLDAQGAKAVAVTAGAATLSGPLVLRGGAPALAVEGAATATVTGTAAAPVRLVGNARGVVVTAEATLNLQGDGGAESLVLEGTTGGAAVFFEVGNGSGACSTVSKVTLRANKGISGASGTGALEVRRRRQVVIDGCTFVDNRRSVTFSGTGGAGGSDASAFLGVHLANNIFTAALPTEGGGSVLCGDAIGAPSTNLFLREGNVFPGTPETLTCEQVPESSQFDCDAGRVFAHSGASTMVRSCEPGACQCVSGSAQCGGS